MWRKAHRTLNSHWNHPIFPRDCSKFQRTCTVALGTFNGKPQNCTRGGMGHFLLPRVQILSSRTNSSNPISIPLSCVLCCQNSLTNRSANTKLQALERLKRPNRLTALSPPSRGFRSPACSRKPAAAARYHDKCYYFEV